MGRSASRVPASPKLLSGPSESKIRMLGLGKFISHHQVKDHLLPTIAEENMVMW